MEIRAPCAFMCEYRCAVVLLLQRWTGASGWIERVLWLAQSFHSEAQLLSPHRCRTPVCIVINQPPFYRSTCVSRHLQLTTGGFFGAQIYCLAEGHQRIRVREKTLEFSSAVLSTLFSYLQNSKCFVIIRYRYSVWNPSFTLPIITDRLSG